jgi:non-specific serine/threonine protein kinase
MNTYDGTVEAFIHAYSPTRQLAGRIFFHLVEHPKGPAPFAFLVTYSTRLGGDGTARHLPLKYALQEYGNDRDKLLELLGTVYWAARTSTLLPPLLESGDIFHPLGWEAQTAYTFLQEVPLYEQSGILCRIPNWWSAKAAGASLRVNIGTAAPTFVGMDAVLDCAPSLMINGVPITAEDARRLLQESEGLALIKNKWVVVDQAKLQQTLKAYEQVRTLLEDGGLTLREALALQLSLTKQLGDEHAGVDVGQVAQPPASHSRGTGHHLPGDPASLSAGRLELVGLFGFFGVRGLPGRRYGPGQNHPAAGIFERQEAAADHQSAGGTGLAHGQLAS